MAERARAPARASLPVLQDQVRRISGLLRELVEYGRAPTDEADVLVTEATLEAALARGWQAHLFTDATSLRTRLQGAGLLK